MFKNSDKNKLLRDLANLSSGTISSLVFKSSNMEVRKYTDLDKLQAGLVAFYQNHLNSFSELSTWNDVWKAFANSDEYVSILDSLINRKNASSVAARTLKTFQILYPQFFNKNKRTFGEIKNDIIDNDYTLDDLDDLEEQIKKSSLLVSKDPMDIYEKKALLYNLEIKDALLKLDAEDKAEMSSSAKQAGIKKSPNGLYQVTDSEGHVLPSNPKGPHGHGHTTREAAEKQLRAIEISKHRKTSGHEFSPLSSQLEDLALALINLNGFKISQVAGTLKVLGDTDSTKLLSEIGASIRSPIINGLTLNELLKKIHSLDDFIKNPKFIHAFVTYAKNMLDFVEPRFKKMGDSLKTKGSINSAKDLDDVYAYAKKEYLETIRMLHAQESVIKKRKKSNVKTSWTHREDFSDFASEYFYFHHNAIVDKIKEIESGNSLYTKYNKGSLDLLIHDAYAWVEECVEEAEENGLDLKSSHYYTKVMNNLKGLDKRVNDSILKQASVSQVKKAYVEIKDSYKKHKNANKLATDLGDLISDMETIHQGPSLKSAYEVQDTYKEAMDYYDSLLAKGARDYNS